MFGAKFSRISHFFAHKKPLCQVLALEITSFATSLNIEKMEWLSPSKKKRKLIASIDQGTSSSRFMVFDKQGNVVAKHQMEHKQYYPRASWVEHDAEEIWQCVKKCINYGMYAGSVTKEEIVSLGITNQRETTVIWNKHTGEPYHKAIVWNDTRTTSICTELEEAGYGDYIKNTTGLPISCYFSGSKIMYLMREVPNLKEAITRGMPCSAQSTLGSCISSQPERYIKQMLQMQGALCSWI